MIPHEETHGIEAGTNRQAVRVVAWELTRRCALACRHCRGTARDCVYDGELSPIECRSVIDGLARFGEITLILTGGEPMMRDDLYDLAAQAHACGMRVVVAPCGPLVTPDSARRLVDAGVAGISISLDGASAETHDAFRGVPGSFAAACHALECARDAGLAFQVNTTVTRHNAAELPAVLDLAITLGARTLDLFFLVPVGRGTDLKDLSLDAREYERALNWVADAAMHSAIRVKTTCAPQYARVLRQRIGGDGQCVGEERETTPVPPFLRGTGKGDTHTSLECSASVRPCSSVSVRAAEGETLSGAARPASREPIGGCPTPHSLLSPAGCMAGRGFLFISHIGILQPCGFLPVPCGDLRECAFDVHAAHAMSTVLKHISDIDAFHGKCSVCEFRHVCGGCRARAYAAQGDYMGEEPLCPHVPSLSLVALEDE